MYDGRVTMLGVSQWTNRRGSYRTVQRWFGSALDWGGVLWAMVEAHLVKTSGMYVLAVDEVVVNKAEKRRMGWGGSNRALPDGPVLATNLI